MKLPTPIRVGYTNYDVVEKAEVDGGRCWGECDRNVGVISLKEGMPSRKRADTLIHELFHAIWGEYNIHEGDDEERIVLTMATAWTQILLDNPELCKFLSHKEITTDDK